MDTEQNRVIFGYMRNALAQIKIHPSERDIVNTIYHAYLEGNSLGRISEMLKTAGLPSPSGKEVWGKQIIDNLLSNEKYLGNDIYPQVVARDLFDEVQQEKAKRSNKGKDHSSFSRYSSAHFLSGLIVCGECGKNYRRTTRTDGKIIWRCANRIEHGSQICKSSLAISETDLVVVLTDKSIQADRLHSSNKLEDMARIIIDKVVIDTDEKMRLHFRQPKEHKRNNRQRCR